MIRKCLLCITIFSTNLYVAAAAIDQQPLAMESCIIPANSGLHALPLLETENNAASCGDIGEGCKLFACCEWALCSPYNYNCHAKVPWSRDQLAPPMYNGTNTRIQVGQALSMRVFRRHNGGQFQGYLTQLLNVSSTGATEVTVTTDASKRAIFWVQQADSQATRLSALFDPSLSGSGPTNYRLLWDDPSSYDWIYINGPLNDTSKSSQLNFVQGKFPGDGQSYYALWFASTMRMMKKSALNIDGSGEGNVKDSGMTAYVQLFQE